MRKGLSVLLFGVFTVWGFAMAPTDGTQGDIIRPLETYRADLKQCYSGTDTLRAAECRRNTHVNFGWEESLVRSVALNADQK